MPAPLSIEELKSRFPLGRTVEKAYLLTLRGTPTFLTLAWKWLLVAIIPACAAYEWYVAPRFQQMHKEMLDKPLSLPVHLTNEIGLASAVLSFVVSIPMASIAVGWHRWILRQQQPTPPDTLRFDPTVWRYWGWIVAFSVLLFLPSIPQLTLWREESVTLHEMVALRYWVPFIVLLLIGVNIPRLSVTLPGIALQNPEATLFQTLRRTRGNTFKLFFGSALAVAPLAMLASFGNSALSYVGSEAVHFASHLFMALARVAASVIALTFLSLSYRHFYEQPKPSGDRSRMNA